MPYATQTDLSPSVISASLLVQLTDDARSGQVNVAIVEDALVRASGDIEIYCRERYKLPLQQTPELTDLCTAIAAMRLYGRREGEIPAGISNGYESAMRKLRDVSANKASLDQTVGSNDQTSSNTIAISRRRQVFGGRNLDGYTG